MSLNRNIPPYSHMSEELVSALGANHLSDDERKAYEEWKQSDEYKEAAAWSKKVQAVLNKLSGEDQEIIIEEVRREKEQIAHHLRGIIDKHL